MEKFSGYYKSSLASNTAVPSSPLVYEGSVGRPNYDNLMSTIDFLVVDCRFSVTQVSNVLCVSVRTVRQRMSEYGICVWARYSSITVQQLDVIASDVQHEFPVCGCQRMLHYLRAKRLILQQNHVRDT